MNTLLSLFILITLPMIGQGQVHIDAVTIQSGDPIYFSDWKYHPGDDPEWADPNVDDSGSISASRLKTRLL